MLKKVALPVVLLVVLSILLSACSPQTTPVPTEVPAAPPADTAVPPTAEPEPEPVVVDYATLFAGLVSEIPADKGYGAVAPAKLMEELADKPPFLLDVREDSELEKNGWIEGAVHLPIATLLENLDKLPAQDQPIVVYCASSHRGGIAMAALKLLGYSDVRNLGGGIGAWIKAELPVATGTLPAAPDAISTPVIENEVLFEELNAFFTNLPEGFYAIGADPLNTQLIEGKEYFLLDVRTAGEVEKNGYIEGSVNVPFEELFTNLDKLPLTDTPMVVICGSSHRAAIATTGLRLLGYEYALNLGGGFAAWKGLGLPVAGVVDWTLAYGEFLAAMPDNFSVISAADLNTALVDKPPFLLDVREVGEVEADGYISGAVNIPVREVLNNLDKLPAKDQPIVVYCASGHRGGMVLSALKLLGYSDVRNLGGGVGAWKKAEFPLEPGLPAAPAAGEAPQVDLVRLNSLNAFLSGMPDGFYTVKAADLNMKLGEATKPFVLDVRSATEIEATGIIEGAVVIPMKELWTRLAELPQDKAAEIVVTCASGHRGAIALLGLRLIGYTNVVNLGGGMNAWIAAELPVVEFAAP